MIPTELRRELAALNAPPAPSAPPPPVTAPGPPAGDIVVGAQVDKGALSPTSAVRGIFPTSKSRSLKKKSSILASKFTSPSLNMR